MPAALTIDVTDVASRVADDALVVLVEPLYACVATALALDSGWASVEIAPDAVNARRVPLASYEVPPPADAPRGADGERRCRVRSSDLTSLLDVLGQRTSTVLLGAPLIARPLASRLASWSLPSNLVLVAVPSTSPGDPRDVSADSWWAAGMLARVVLDELDGVRDVQLADGAGMAVAIARGSESAQAELGRGLRWFRHLQFGGTTDDLRIAASVDHCAVVPVVDQATPTSPWIARALAPAPPPVA